MLRIVQARKGLCKLVGMSIDQGQPCALVQKVSDDCPTQVAALYPALNPRCLYMRFSI